MKPPDLNQVIEFLQLHPDRMFIFVDQRACMTYEKDVDQVLYLIGAFDKDAGELYNTHVAKMAKEAQMN